MLSYAHIIEFHNDLARMQAVIIIMLYIQSVRSAVAFII